MSLALAATGLVASTEAAAPAANSEEETVAIGEWTPELESYVARLVANGVPNSGKCPLQV